MKCEVTPCNPDRLIHHTDDLRPGEAVKDAAGDIMFRNYDTPSTVFCVVPSGSQGEGGDIFPYDGSINQPQPLFHGTVTLTF